MDTITVMNYLPLILGSIGIGLMIGLSAAGSAIGLAISGSSAIGALKKRPEAFGSVLVASVLPSTQGIYGFVAFFLYYQKLSADMTLLAGAGVLAAGIMMGLAALISAIFQGKVCASSASAIGSGHNTLAAGLILGAMPEFYAIIALVACIIFQGII